MNLQYFSDSVVDKEKALLYSQIQSLLKRQNYIMKEPIAL